MTESTDKQLPDEQQLDEYLKGDSSVSRHYRQLHSAEVPTELDRLVLRQAEDAVKSRPGQVRAGQGRPAWLRWTAPLAVAASAVLVLSIVVETGMRDETLVRQAPQPTMEAQRERLESKAEDSSASGQAAPQPSSVPQAGAATELANEEQFATSATPEQMIPAVPPEPQLDVPSPRVQRSIRPTTAPPPVTDDSMREAPAPVAQDRRSAPPVAAPAPAPVMPTRSVGNAAAEAERMLQAASVEEAARKRSAVTGEVAAEEERSELAKTRQINADMAASQPVYLDPEEWLKAIRQLRNEKKQEQANREWRRFRAAFPNHEVAETDIAREARK